MAGGLKGVLNPWRLAVLSTGFNGELIDVSFLSRGRRMNALVPTSELWVAVKDVLVYEDYEILDEFRLSFLPKDALVVDAGAFVGLFSLKASPFAKKVISLEPSVTNYGLFSQNLNRNGCSNVTPLNLALSASSAPERFQDRGTSSSLVGSDGRGTYLVETTNIGQVVSDLGHVDLLKMDVEGAEYRVLLATSASDLKNIDRLVAELHFRSTQEVVDLDALLSHLKAAGMSVRVLSSPVQGARYGFAKPWRCSLEGFANGPSFGYRLLLSSLYGAAPITRHLRGVYDVGTTQMLFASRLHELG